MHINVVFVRSLQHSSASVSNSVRRGKVDATLTTYLWARSLGMLSVVALATCVICDAPLHGSDVLALPGLCRQLHADTQSSLLTMERTLLVYQNVKAACSMPQGTDCAQRISDQRAAH